jgi:hypothetical protein
MAMAAATTEPQPARPDARRRPKRGAGPDRITVLLLSLAAFFAMLALLATQLRMAGPVTRARQVVVLRRVYQTTVIERVPPNVRAKGGVSSSTQSVSGSVPAAPTTRSS